MPKRLKRIAWNVTMKLFRPDMEHFLCLAFCSLLGLVGLVVWTYETDFTDRRFVRADTDFQGVVDSFARDHRLWMEERHAANFPEFPDPAVPDVLQKHREAKARLNAAEKADRVLEDINSSFKYKKRRSRKKVISGDANVTQVPVVTKRRFSTRNALQGGEAYCKIYDTRPNNTDEFECIHLDFSPPAQVCLYDTSADAHVSYHLRKAGLWEPHILRHFQNLLFQDPDLGVYDIGSHIGQYGLLAATMGRKVVAVEPFLPSLQRLHKAIKLGQLQDKVILIQNAISDQRDTFELSIPEDNKGGVRLTSQDADRFCTDASCPPHATTVLMDDLLEVTNFEKAIIKIDIEGHEHRAFVQSRRLFENVQIHYIFMEWMKLREYYGSEADDSLDKQLVFQLIDYLVEMGYTPRGILLLERLNPQYWYGWPDDVLWEADRTVRNAWRATTTRNSPVKVKDVALLSERRNSTSVVKDTEIGNSKVEGTGSKLEYSSTFEVGDGAIGTSNATYKVKDGGSQMGTTPLS